MKILERMIQYIYLSDEAIMEKEKKFEAVANRVGGFPPKVRYRTLFGKEKSDVFIWDRVWNSLDEMAAAYGKLHQQPEMAEIRKMPPDFGPALHELYYIMEE